MPPHVHWMAWALGRPCPRGYSPRTRLVDHHPTSQIDLDLLLMSGFEASGYRLGPGALRVIRPFRLDLPLSVPQRVPSSFPEAPGLASPSGTSWKKWLPPASFRRAFTRIVVSYTMDGMKLPNRNVFDRSGGQAGRVFIVIRERASR